MVQDTGHQKQSDPALKQLSVVAKAKSSILQKAIVGFDCGSPFKGHGFRQPLLKVERWAQTDSKNQTAPYTTRAQVPHTFADGKLESCRVQLVLWFKIQAAQYLALY